MMSPILRSIAVLLLLCVALPAVAQVAVTPQIQDISLDGPTRTYAFRFINFSKEIKRVKVSVSNWSMDASGKITEVPSQQQSLDHWIEINPTEFTVPAGQAQVVRFAVRPAMQLAPGEHRAMVFFNEDPLPGQIAKPGTFRLQFRIGAAIYGHVGPIDRSGRIVSAKADARGVAFELRNTGNATTRIQGVYAVWKKAAIPAAAAALPANMQEPRFTPPPGMMAHGLLPQDAVLPEVTRAVDLHFSTAALPVGQYVLRMRGVIGPNDVTRDIPIDVTRPTH